MKHNQIPTPEQQNINTGAPTAACTMAKSHITPENTHSEEWQKSPHKHIMNKSRQSITPTSPEITTKNQYTPRDKRFMQLQQSIRLKRKYHVIFSPQQFRVREMKN